MTRPLVVGFLGRMGSGKTTCAKHIIAKYGGTRASFAYPLKELAKHLWLLSNEQVYGIQASKDAIDPRHGISPREACKRLGHGARQVFGEDFWVNRCFDYIKSEQAKSNKLWNPFLIDDVRYRNEVELIKNNPDFNSAVIKLICSDLPNVDEHPSEKEVDLVDYSLIDAVIESRITPNAEDLKSQLDKVVKEVILGRTCRLS